MLDRARDWRSDARFGVVVLIVVAVVAGVVWYRIGIGGGSAAGRRVEQRRVARATDGTTATGVGQHHDRHARRSTGGGSPTRIAVHVAGAVAHPGVVELGAGTRVVDAVEAVGGAHADADLDRLNLAAKLADGQRVYVPKVGEADPGVLGGGGDAAGDRHGAHRRRRAARRQAQPQHRHAGPARGAPGDRPHLRAVDPRRAAAPRRLHVGERAPERARHRRQALRRAGTARHRVTAHAPVGPLLVLAGLVVGILAGERRGPGSRDRRRSCRVSSASTIATIVTRPPTRIVVALLAFALLGTAAMQRALHGLEVSPLSAPILARDDVVVRATLVDDPDGTRFSSSVLVRVDRVAHGGATTAGGRRRLLVTASGDAGPRLQLLSAGEGVTLRGWLEPLTGFDTRWKWQHAVGTLHATELLDAPCRSRAARPARQHREARGARVAPTHSQPVDRALLAGFLLGDTRGVPDDVTEQFRAVGPLSSGRGVRRERRVRLGAVRAAAAPARAVRPARGRPRRCWCCSAR